MAGASLAASFRSSSTMRFCAASTAFISGLSLTLAFRVSCSQLVMFGPSRTSCLAIRVSLLRARAPLLHRRAPGFLERCRRSVGVGTCEIALQRPRLLVEAEVFHAELPVPAGRVAAREAAPAILNPGDVQPPGVLDADRHP